MPNPIKLQMALTQACIDLHNANSTKDIEHLSEMSVLFEKNGYTFPGWISAWMKLVEEDSLLNAEEHFNKTRDGLFMTEESEKSYRIAEKLLVSKATRAIDTICNDYYSPKRYALFVIASEILLDKNEFNELGHEWHCKSNEFYTLSHQPNYWLFLEMLKREIDFWQESARNRISPPAVHKLTPSINSI